MEIISLIVGILVGGIITFFVSYYFFKKSPSKKEIKEISQKLEKIKGNHKYEKLYDKVKDAINRKQIEIEKVLSKLTNPIYAILVRKYNEDKTHKIEKFFKDPNSNFKIIGAGLYLLPPDKCPKITSDFNVREWFQQEILNKIGITDNYKRIFSFISIIDLRKTIDERVIAIRGRTIFEVLGKDKQLMASILSSKKVMGEISKIIDNSDISFLIDKDCSSEELKNIQSKSNFILRDLNKSELTELFTLDEEFIADKLKDCCSNAQNVSRQIKENSLFWNNFFKT